MGLKPIKIQNQYLINIFVKRQIIEPKKIIKIIKTKKNKNNNNKWG